MKKIYSDEVLMGTLDLDNDLLIILDKHLEKQNRYLFNENV